jgi:nitrogen fixation NifU-like protein
MGKTFRQLAMTGVCPDCGADIADDVERLTPLSGVHEFPSRVKCATLAWHTLNAALDGAKEASSE